MYNKITARAPVPSGLGHKFYEKYRVLPKDSLEAQKIAQKSRDYYDTVRKSNASQ